VFQEPDPVEIPDHCAVVFAEAVPVVFVWKSIAVIVVPLKESFSSPRFAPAKMYSDLSAR